ncbi:hypothetical protein RHMOL_Rhmol08G0248300 [Rhododendron molle]|uniref:Uncharacterized protein n=1 Tax=Rhododendron molle TaxID=49168 RepID=A0ACC0MT46_RHOML|nr:hypothetical protein RHMOL_Rhmol08G0248300 [Rhododendron molle]
MGLQGKLHEYDQDTFLEAEKTNGIGKLDKEALRNLTRASKDGFEKLMRKNKLDAWVTPQAVESSVLAVGGYPAINVPAGYNGDGVPWATKQSSHCFKKTLNPFFLLFLSIRSQKKRDREDMTGPTVAMEPVEPQSLKMKRALDLLSPDLHVQFPLPDPDSKKIRMSQKFNAEYGGIKSTSSQPLIHAKSGSQDQAQEGFAPSNALALAGPENSKDPPNGGAQTDLFVGPTVQTKGLDDRTIKIWDMATERLKLTLTGHIGQVRGLAVSNKHPYMFSAGDDEQVKCWDLEQNRVIRSYPGHLSGVYCMALHPTRDILLTGGRDSVCRVWDIRSNMGSCIVWA